MHPVIRIILFIILAGFVAFGDSRQLLLAFLLLFLALASSRFQSLQLSVRFLKRMRWFFVSILIIYLWFTPGRPLIGEGAAYMPSIEGLQTGALRICSLILIVLAVNYFVSMIARNPLVAAIVWLLSPLKLIGIDHKIIALRMVLTLELIPKVQGIVMDVANLEHSTAERKFSNSSFRQFGKKLLVRLSSIGGTMEKVFEQILREATTMESKVIDIKSIHRPPVYQWFYPLMLYGVFVAAAFVNTG